MTRVNVNKLKGKVVEKEMSIASLAEKLSMDKSTLYRKIASGGMDFTIGDVQNIMDALSLTPSETASIFFEDVVA